MKIGKKENSFEQPTKILKMDKYEEDNQGLRAMKDSKNKEVNTDIDLSKVKDSFISCSKNKVYKKCLLSELKPEELEIQKEKERRRGKDSLSRKRTAAEEEGEGGEIEYELIYSKGEFMGQF